MDRVRVKRIVLACKAGIIVRARNWRNLRRFQNVNSISSQKGLKASQRDQKRRAKGIKSEPKGSKLFFENERTVTPVSDFWTGDCCPKEKTDSWFLFVTSSLFCRANHSERLNSAIRKDQFPSLPTKRECRTDKEKAGLLRKEKLKASIQLAEGSIQQIIIRV